MTQAFRTLPLHPILAFGIVAASAVACAAPALADSPAPLSAPGLGEEVYGATVEAHEFELESRYGMLTGGSADGQQNARVEGEYGVNANLAVAVMGEFERAPSDRLKPMPNMNTVSSIPIRSRPSCCSSAAPACGTSAST